MRLLYFQRVGYFLIFAAFFRPFCREQLFVGLIFALWHLYHNLLLMPLNAPFLTVFVVSFFVLIVIDFSFLQPVKAFFPIFVTFFPIVILVRLVQPAKAFFPIEVMLLPITIFLIFLVPLKALPAIEVTL